MNFYDNEVGNPALPSKFQAANRPVPAPPPTRRNYLVAGTAIAALVVVGATIVFLIKRNDSRAVAGHNDATPAVKATIPEKSVAVLPFENLTSDKENAYFADGIQEEILTRLAKIADLKVISRTSTLQYKSAPENLSQIAQQLGVAHVVEGSVQKSGEAVRVNVQLINALTEGIYGLRLTIANQPMRSLLRLTLPKLSQSNCKPESADVRAMQFPSIRPKTRKPISFI